MTQNGLCELCRRDPAQLVVCWASKSGRREERSLCEACARDSERILFGDGGLLLTELLQAYTTHSAAEYEQNRTKVCPICGNTGDSISETGEVGCSTCYEIFREEIDSVIFELHGYPHSGGEQA